VGKDVGDGIAIRHDWGPQYIARDIVGRWMETYNNQWLIERHGHRTPREVRQTQEESQSAVA